MEPSRNENSASVIPLSPVLEDLRRKVEGLPKTIPLAKKTHTLAAYNCPPKDLTSGTLDDELWEIWDQKLNVLLPHEMESLGALVVRGKYGLIGLVTLLEHLVRDRHLDAGLLEGKVTRLIQAIDRYGFNPFYSNLLTNIVSLELLARLTPKRLKCSSLPPRHKQLLRNRSRRLKK